LGVLGGKSEEENHAHLPQFRTVGEMWGLGLNSSEEPLGPCGEDDGSSESGRGIPSASLDPPRHRPPEECVRVSEEDLEFGLRGEGEAADKTDVPDVPVAKKWPGLSRGGSVSKKISSGRVGYSVGVKAGPSSSSSLLSSSVRRALKAPPMT
jgi:hypothetical protein